MNGFDTAEMVERWIGKRQSWLDLYPSEKAIFDWLDMREVKSVLDVGCAVGGFSTLFPFSKYTGVDASPAMLKVAAARHPDRTFLAEIPEETFDLVMCLGTLHIVENWRGLFETLWKSTAKSLVFDLRLDLDGSEGEHEGMEGTPYRIVSYREASELLDCLDAKDVKMCSYRHVSNRTDHREVTMAAFLLERP